MSSNKIQVQLCKKYNNSTNQLSKCCWTNKLAQSLSWGQSFYFDGIEDYWGQRLGMRDGGENLGACENFELDGPDIYIKGKTDTKLLKFDRFC